jgi:hypothetical protein
MGNKQTKTKTQERTEQGGGACGFICVVLIIIALAVNELSHYTLTFTLFVTTTVTITCGFDTIRSDWCDNNTCDTFSDACQLCKDTDGCDPEDYSACKTATAGIIYMLCNIIALICCLFVGLGIFVPQLARARSLLKFAYVVAAIAILIAILWWCFASDQGGSCYIPADPTDTDTSGIVTGEYGLNASIIIDILVLIITAFSAYCVK